MKDKLNVAVAISGGGSTLEAILRAAQDGRLPRVNVALVIASNSDAGGIEKAKARGVPSENICVIRRNNFERGPNDSLAFGEEIIKECKSRQVEIVAQCGFIPLMPPNVVHEYRNGIFNQHPGPLDGARPGFGGKGMKGRAVHCAVLHFARRVGRPFRSEATVHWVSNEIDGGGLIDIAPVEICSSDDVPALAARVLRHEHFLIIRTLLRFSELGGVNGCSREEPLIHDGEQDLLAEAIREGIRAYPDG